jgi:RNA polymerase sigma-70 factor (ECF subfamily)
MASQDEFVEAFLKYEPDLRAFIGALVRNRQDAEDVYQETALVLWRKYEEYDPRRPFAAWAKGVAANKVLQCRTKSGRVPTPFAPETITVIVDALGRREPRRSQWPTMLDALDKCADTLPEASRQMLGWRYRDGWSIRKIAERLASTPAAVSMSLSRVRARLKDCVEQDLRRQEKEQAP